MTGATSGSARRPTYANLAAAYPRKSLLRAQLYEEIGIGELTLRREYENTCAIRMSYGLAKAGVFLPKGGLKINKGPYKGKRIEPSMRKLAHYLVELWGDPERFESDTVARAGIGQRKGVIAFFFGDALPLVGAQGHIDVVQPTPSGFYECIGACFFDPRNQVWFWPLE